MMVLMLRALGLGDFLTGVPAYRALVRAYPNHRRVLAAPALFAQLAELVGGIDIADARALTPLDPSLSNAEIGVNLHGRGPHSHRIIMAARARRILAYKNEEIGEIDGPLHETGEHEVLRWCRLLRWYGIEADPNDLDLRRPPILVPKRFRGATLVHVGAGAAARRWPSERWSSVIADLLGRGERVVLTAGAHESEQAHLIARTAHLPDTHVLAGRASLIELAALVAAAGRVVSTDTGVAHLATAYRVPSLVLFGPSSPEVWGPPKTRALHRVIWKGTTGDPNAAAVDQGLLRITPEEVRVALARITAATRPPSKGKPRARGLHTVWDASTRR